MILEVRAPIRGIIPACTRWAVKGRGMKKEYSILKKLYAKVKI
jgi:hypothetical protein